MAKRLPNKTLSEIKKIKASNDAYYKALSARDMRAMEKVWTCATDNMLIAPPANPLVRRLVGNQTELGSVLAQIR